MIKLTDPTMQVLEALSPQKLVGYYEVAPKDSTKRDETTPALLRFQICLLRFCPVTRTTAQNRNILCLVTPKQ